MFTLSVLYLNLALTYNAVYGEPAADGNSNTSYYDFISQVNIKETPISVMLNLTSTYILNSTITIDLQKHADTIDIGIANRSKTTWTSQQYVLLTGNVVGEQTSRVYGFIDLNGSFQGDIYVNNRMIMIEQDVFNNHDKKLFVYEVSERKQCKFNIFNKSCLNHNDSIDDQDQYLQNYRRQALLNSFTNLANQVMCQSKSINQPSDPLGDKVRYSRSKIDKYRKTCMMFFRIDHTVLKRLKPEGNIDMSTQSINTLINNLQLIIYEVNTVYSELEVTFGKTSIKQPVKFKLKRAVLLTEDDCQSPEKRVQICAKQLDIANLLEAHSKENFDDYCLAYTVTARDYGGILGLAYMSAPGRLGGICSRYNKERSLNAGVITIINGQRMISRITWMTTLAHEIAHNLGAEHDPENSKCTPGGIDGNYLMYAHATSGYKTNNKRFSACSIRFISKTFERIENGQIYNCFESSNASICGNGILEQGEECDCGYTESCNLVDQKCCYPGDHPDENLRCKLTTGSKCSPLHGQCCTDACQFKVKGTSCKNDMENDCIKMQQCSGNSYECPTPISSSEYMPDRIICNNGTGSCSRGVCSGSVCNHFQMLECTIDDKATNKTIDLWTRLSSKCQVNCIINGKCQSLKYIANYSKLNLAGVQTSFPPGTVCDNGKGYCDIFQYCQTVDNDGTISQLTRKISISIVKGLKKHWIVALVFALILLVLACLLVKYCGKYTPSNNPHMKKHVKLSTKLKNNSSKKSNHSFTTTSSSTTTVLPFKNLSKNHLKDYKYQQTTDNSHNNIQRPIVSREMQTIVSSIHRKSNVM